LDENFYIIYNFDRILKNYYFKDEIDYKKTGPEMISISIITLIESLNKIDKIWDKWK